MIIRVSGLNPVGVAKNPKMTATDIKPVCQSGECQDASTMNNYDNQGGKSGLAFSLKVLIGAFCAALGYCIFTGLKSTFSTVK